MLMKLLCTVRSLRLTMRTLCCPLILKEGFAIFLFKCVQIAVNLLTKQANTTKSLSLQRLLANMLFHSWTFLIKTMWHPRDFSVTIAHSTMVYLSKICKESAVVQKTPLLQIILLIHINSSRKMVFQLLVGMMILKIVN